MSLIKQIPGAAAFALLLTLAAAPVYSQAVAAPAAAVAPLPAAVMPPLPTGAVVRRVVMRDGANVEQFRLKLETMKANGLFKDQLAGLDPKKPVLVEISFLASGNYLLVVGSKDWVDNNIDTIRVMAYLFERPRAHLQLNLRVVQLTGPANAEVVQMAETVRALVESERDEVVRTFADLDDYLTQRIRRRMGSDSAIMESARHLLPSLGKGDRPMTVPEILLLLMLDRSAPAPAAAATDGGDTAGADAALLDLSQTLAALAQDPPEETAPLSPELTESLHTWKVAVAAARDWCLRYADEIKADKQGPSIQIFRDALDQPGSPIPTWLARRLKRSLEITERLYPSLVRKHTEASLRELQRRFASALDRADELEKQLTPAPATPAPKTDGGAPETPKSEERRERKKHGDKSGDEKKPQMGQRGHALLSLKSLAEGLVPTPLAMFQSVALTADSTAPAPEQLVQMFDQYAVERQKLDLYLAGERPGPGTEVNYSRLQALEAGLNLWLRRVSESMAQALEQQCYRRYVNKLRVLANKQLGKTSNRDLLTESGINEVPDLARDLLLADTGVNVFVTNSVSLQFAPETTNTVSAQVQSRLPSKVSIAERVQEAATASTAFTSMSNQLGINGNSVVQALLAGGEAVPVQSGLNLSAMPSIGFDGSTISLTLTANQTLEPGSSKVTDRVTNHSISNATVTALSYEPMVLSTLTSNISYYESVGGIPVLRKTPGLKTLLKDIPLAPFKEGKRQKGVYQSSVIILEPVVVPTIEDLVRYHAAWGAEPASKRPIVTVRPN